MSTQDERIRQVFRCGPQYKRALAAAAEHRGINTGSFIRHCIALVVAGPHGAGLADEDRATLLMGATATPRAFSAALNAKSLAADAGQ